MSFDEIFAFSVKKIELKKNIYLEVRLKALILNKKIENQKLLQSNF